jgi:Rad3-related DNA helicase
MEFDLSKIDEYFPFDTFRDGQRECIEFILKSFAAGKKYVIFEGPVGSGKSAVGITVAKFFQDSYYLTIQKILQAQLMNDFGGNGVVDLKGRSAYHCNFYKNFGEGVVQRKGMTQKDLDKILANPPTCDSGYCRRKSKARRSALCFQNATEGGFITRCLNSTCPYYRQIALAAVSRMAIMNYSSFLYQMAIPNRFTPRELLITDECHNSEPQLLDYISITINDKRLRKRGYVLEKFEMPEEYCASFMENEVVAKIRAIASEAEEAGEPEDLKMADEYSRLATRLESFYDSMRDGEDWVAEFRSSDGFSTVTLKPIFVHSKSHKLLFDHGQKVLMMSATILEVDIFCSSLGIPRDQVAAYRMKNRFPLENRPIYVRSAGRIVGGAAKMPEWAPKLVAKTDEILDKYKHDRGIIHTHNFAIANMLMEKSRHNARFLYQRNFPTKDALLAEHSNSDNTVIVAPAMHEGLDLYNDLSRIQIICKVPWPNFVDNKQLARRLELDRRYYLWLTALKLIQSSGRSIRSESDWAHTYVLDEVFNGFIQDARSMIPSWFKDAVEFGRLNESTYKSVPRVRKKVPKFDTAERVIDLD